VHIRISFTVSRRIAEKVETVTIAGLFALGLPLKLPGVSLLNAAPLRKPKGD